MAKFVIIAFMVCLSTINVYGMDCSFGQGGTFKTILSTCPRPILDSADKSYCCVDTEGEMYCCDIYQFALTGLGILIPIIIVALVLSCVISCICCFCCPFCCLYRRRSAGSFI